MDGVHRAIAWLTQSMTETGQMDVAGSKSLDAIEIPPQRIAAMRARGLWRDEVLTSAFDRTVAARPDSAAIVSFDSASGQTSRKSWSELAGDVDRIARGLSALGARSGTVVSVQLPSGWEFAAIVLACTRLGCIVNPIMPSARERELVAALQACTSRFDRSQAVCGF